MIFTKAEIHAGKRLLIQTNAGRVEDEIIETAKAGTLIKFKKLGWLKFTECELLADLSLKT